MPPGADLDWPAPNEIHVWSRDLAEIGAGDVARDVLDRSERDRVASFRSADDRRRYRTAHTDLRVLVGRYLGIAPAGVRISRARCPVCDAPHGKPSLGVGHPLRFSLAHCESTVVFAFARAPVGVDVELMREEQLRSDALTALHPDERSLLHRLSRPLRHEAFYRCFVRKEAYLKGLGLGLAVEPSDVFVGFGAPPELRHWTVRDLDVGAGHAAAVALETDCEPSIRHRHLRPCGGDVSPRRGSHSEQDVDERWIQNACF